MIKNDGGGQPTVGQAREETWSLRPSSSGIVILVGAKAYLSPMNKILGLVLYAFNDRSMSQASGLFSCLAVSTLEM